MSSSAPWNEEGVSLMPRILRGLQLRPQIWKRTVCQSSGGFGKSGAQASKTKE